MLIFRRPYGAAATIDGVCLISKGLSDYQANPTLAAGDVQISKDGGAFANLATLPVVTPAAGIAVRVSMSATELTCARAVIKFIDQTAPKEWEDEVAIVETEGSTSAQHTAAALPTATPGAMNGLVIVDAKYLRLLRKAGVQ